MVGQLKIQTISGGPLDVNCYVVSKDDSKECVIIDPGVPYDQVAPSVGDRSVSAILLTHAHFDHMLYANEWIEKGAQLYLHHLDEPAIADPYKNLSYMLGSSLCIKTACHPLADCECFKEAGIDFTVLHTPGHTPGSICYLSENVIFTGDTLFHCGYGRVDFPGGSLTQMNQSLTKLLSLDGGKIVYPGHGPQTRIELERRYIR